MAVISKRIPAPDLVKVKTALLSVSDKEGVVELAKSLYDMGISLVSTGGTFKTLSAAGIPVRDVQT